MDNKNSRISYEDFNAQKNRLYRLLKDGSKDIKDLKSQANELLKEVHFIYKDESISDPKWVVNVSELREFYNGLEFNHDLVKKGSYRTNDNRIPYRSNIYKHDYIAYGTDFIEMECIQFMTVT